MYTYTQGLHAYVTWTTTAVAAGSSGSAPCAASLRAQISSGPSPAGLRENGFAPPRSRATIPTWPILCCKWWQWLE